MLVYRPVSNTFRLEWYVTHIKIKEDIMPGETPFPLMGGETPFPLISGQGPVQIQGEACEFQKLPPSESCRRIDFHDDGIEIRPGFVSNTWILIVNGTKPYMNMHVSLVPVTYIRQPEYWEIEVVGCVAGIGLPALAPYSVFLSLYGATGTKGIEVVGATKKKRLPVPPLK